MTVDFQQDRIVLSGDCPIEDADALLALLDASPGARVDLARAGHLHAAIFQALLSRDAQAIEPAGDQFVERWLRPCLKGPANV